MPRNDATFHDILLQPNGMNLLVFKISLSGSVQDDIKLSSDPRPLSTFFDGPPA